MKLKLIGEVAFFHLKRERYFRRVYTPFPLHEHREELGSLMIWDGNSCKKTVTTEDIRADHKSSHY